MDLHVFVCAVYSLHPVLPVGTDPLWLPRPSQVVFFAVWHFIPALPSSGSRIPAHLYSGDQQFPACVLLHHHPGTGR